MLHPAATISLSKNDIDPRNSEPQVRLLLYRSPRSCWCKQDPHQAIALISASAVSVVTCLAGFALLKLAEFQHI